MSKSYNDRRVDPRHDVELELHGTADDGAVVARMTASNVSLGGLYCTSTRDFPEMTRLAVRMVLPDGTTPTPMDVEAVVVRRERVASPTGNGARYHLALFFTRIDDEHKSALADYLQGHA